MPRRLLTFLASAAFAAAADNNAALTLIESKCLACHSGQFKKSGLDLTSREGLVRGGDRGPAVVPGEAKASLLYKVIARTVEPHMPFQMAKLPDADIARIAEWINQGAPFPQPLRAAAPAKHWAFETPKRLPLPRKTANPIDAFLSAAREKRGLQPLPPAEPRVLLRRLYVDLIGVPPTRDEIHAFLADSSPRAYENAVDKLLADSRYGERWGRHWMDVWRYSDWYGWRKGNDVRNSAKFIWRWRDWIVESLNQDKGYDRMVTEMLAGDEIAPGDPQVLRATGYLARSFSKYDRHGWMQDAVDHTAMAFLGVTLKCARCHDHKYDPLSQEEYFRFRAFFEPYQVRTDRVPGQPDTAKDGLARVFDEDAKAPTFLLIRGDIQTPDKDHPLGPATPSALRGLLGKIEPVPLPLESYYPDHRAFVHADLIAQAKAEIEKAEAALKEAKADERTLSEKALASAKAALPALEARIAADRAAFSKPPSPEAETLAEAARKAEREAGILKADENLFRAQRELTQALAARKPGEPVDEKRVTAASRQVDAAKAALTREAAGYTPIGKSYPESSSGRRLALARWIANKDNPLTARVAINHIWLRHFGKALVPTVFDFGRNGKAPSHPDLLDWLASEFMQNGWSMKKMHRLILTSQAYRMRSSAGTADHPNAALDPDNIYLWRMNSRRMEAETVRDSLLHLAGRLDPAMGGPEIDAIQAQDSQRRSIYLQHTPDVPSVFMKVFDSANPAECYERNESVVPHQALAMANSKLSREQAKAVAQRLGPAEAPAFVDLAFEAVLGRPASSAEKAAAVKFLLDTAGPAAARENLVHVLLNHNDFVTIR